MLGKGSHQKNGKKFHNSCELSPKMEVASLKHMQMLYLRIIQKYGQVGNVIYFMSKLNYPNLELNHSYIVYFFQIY